MKIKDIPSPNMRGFIAPLIALVAISISILISPDFSWFDNALSDLGHYTRTDLGDYQLLSAIIFNSGLIITGILQLSYVVSLTRESEDLINKVGTGIFCISAVFLILIGVFSENFPPVHFIVSVGFFATFPFAMWIVGIGSFRQKSLRWFGVLSILLPVLSVYIWWGTYADLMPWTGVALPEIITALTAILWIWLVDWLDYKNKIQ